jgi:hypothetical protein
MVLEENAERGEATMAGETGADRSIWQIIIGVFAGPTEAFEAYNRRPRIWVILILTIVLGFISNAFLSVYNAQMQADLIAKSSTLPPEVLGRMQENAQNPDRIMGGVTGAGAQVVFGVIMALLAWGVGSFVMGGNSKFKNVWGVTMLAGLIPLIGSLVKLPLMAAKNSMYVSFGLAALLPGKDFTSMVYWLLYFFDGFVIWAIIVGGIGNGIIFNITRGKGIAVSVIVTFVVAAVSMALMLVGMSFAGVKITFF